MLTVLNFLHAIAGWYWSKGSICPIRCIIGVLCSIPQAQSAWVMCTMPGEDAVARMLCRSCS